MRTTKKSGIDWLGDIPSDWKIQRGKAILTKLERPVKENDGVITCFRDGEVTLRSNRREDGFTFSFQEAGYQGIEPGDLVVHGMDGFAGAIGISDSRGKATPVLNVLDSTQNKQYIMYYLRNMAYNGVFLALATGIRVRSCDTNWNKLKNLPYAIPCIDEQARIAAFLDKECAEIDVLISRTKDSITEYRKMRQSIISQAVTKGIRGDRPMKNSDIKWAQQIPVEWYSINPKALFTQRKDKAKPGERQLTASQQYGVIYQDEYMALTGSKVVTVEKDFGILKHVEAGDFVISMRSFQGGLEYSTNTGSISSAYVMLIPNQELVYPRFFRWLFKSSVYINALQSTSNMVRDGQAMRYSNFAQVRLYTVPLDEQKEIANYLDEKCAEIDRLIAMKEQFLAEIENYKRSLIYEYVTGKKEVPQVQHSSIVTFVDARALLMCRIIELLKPKGRIHLLKAMYSIDCLLGLNNETQYLRYTHGPYDARIEEYEKALIQKGWINVRQGSPVDYTLGANFEDYRQAYQAQFANVDVKIQKICAFLGPMKTSQTERIATLLAVWNDFILDGITPTDQQIVNEVRTNWTPNKAHSSEETWLGTLDKMRKNGFVPTGKGKHTASAN